MRYAGDEVHGDEVTSPNLEDQQILAWNEHNDHQEQDDEPEPDDWPDLDAPDDRDLPF